MKHRISTLLLAITIRGASALLFVSLPGGLLLAVLQPGISYAESKRIVVYPLSQSFVDTRIGDTLSAIAARLLPNNPYLQQELMADILNLNPDAFIDHSPDRLLANKRLWLPNHFNNTNAKPDAGNYRVESFNWGTVKRPR